MARVIPGPVVADITGALGSVVFAHLFRTQYVRRKQKRYRSNTPIQATNRALFARFARTFSRSGWQKGREFSTIVFSLGVHPFNRYMHALLSTARTGQSHSVLPARNGLALFDSFAVTYLPDWLFTDCGVNTSPHTVRTHILYVGANSKTVIQQSDRPPGASIGFFIQPLTLGLTTPITLLVFPLVHSTGPPYPLTAILWAPGESAIVS